MRAIRRFVEFIIILIALGAALYLQRVPILDWYQNITKPAVPESVTHQDVVEELENKVDEPEEQKEILDQSEPEILLENISDSQQELHAVEIQDEVLEVDLNNNEDITSEDDVIESEPFVLPSSINLAVPFTPQAPHADWAYPYKESCEEASVYMVHGFYEGLSEGLIDSDVAKEEILKIVDFENGLFGYYEDTTAEQTGVLAELMYGYSKVETIKNPTIDQIKTHVAKGRPVIVPAAGRLLGNPHFQQPGPIYHMLVIRGYTEDGMFITNDPGTRNGEEFLYSFDTIMSSMHDWNKGNEITEGQKVVLIIYPN